MHADAVDQVTAEVEAYREEPGSAVDRFFTPPVAPLVGADKDGCDKAADNAVSALQELIQSCSSFSPHTKILTWSFEQQLEKSNALEFRATVSFVLGDVPHHFCGGWQTSKKKAQRDAAERVTHYLQNARSSSLPSHAALDPEFLPEDVLQEMESIYDGTPFEGEPALEWKMEDSAGDTMSYRAILTVDVHDVPHHFAGGWCSGENMVAASNAARRDTIERVLWYFGRSDENFAAVKQHADLNAASSRPPPTATNPSAGEAGSPDKQPQLEDKTILMQVQNTLQKVFAKNTPPGERVWVWSYEGDETDPQLFRARVEIPSWNRSFIGGWCKGKKMAQRNACLVVKESLDSLPTQ